MELIFSDTPIPSRVTSSIFLAGPSPRAKNVFDWRKNALEILEHLNYSGTVYIPIPRGKFYGQDDEPGWTYLGQIAWECATRKACDKILFWVEREINVERQDLGMPGFTTNVEFGEDLASGKMVYGRPDSAVKNKYLDLRYSEDKNNGEIYRDLAVMLEAVVKELGDGAERHEGEVFVPLLVWNTEQFQSWYRNLKLAGNILTHADVKNVMKFGPNFVFSYTMKVEVWVTQEERFKSNEFVFSRRDISCVVPYYKSQGETYVVLIKEFRSPVSNSDGYVYELPGGSAVKANVDPKDNAQHELHEETGLLIENIERFEYVASRQLVATTLTHMAHVYRVELTEQEFEEMELIYQSEQFFGLEADTERTTIEIMNINELADSLVDWSMIGMIMQAVKK